MLVERPFLREYSCAQQGSYLRNQQLFGLQRVMENLEQLPTMNFQGFNGVSRDQVQRWQHTEKRKNHAAIRSKPMSNINSSLVSRGQAYYGSMESKRAVRCDYPTMKQKVSAFGPEHADHARKFYLSKTRQPEFRQVVIPPYRPNYAPMQVPYFKNSGVNEGGYYIGEAGFGRTINRTTLYKQPAMRREPAPATSRTYETVLKVAKISPRPTNKQPTKQKTILGFGEKLLKKKAIVGTSKKSIDFQKSEEDMDLLNAPVFQILCEISKT